MNKNSLNFQWIVALMLLSTVVPFTNCCSSRRMPQRRPSYSTIQLPSSSVAHTEKSPSSSLSQRSTGSNSIVHQSPSLFPASSSSLYPSSVLNPARQPPSSSSSLLPGMSYAGSASAAAAAAAAAADSGIASPSSSSSSYNSRKQQQHNIVTTERTTTTTSTRAPLTINDSNCTSDYKKDYCLNDGICFNYTIQQNYTLLSCLCADGFYGERCEDKYLEGSYSNKLGLSLQIAAAQAVVAGLCVTSVIVFIRSIANRTKKRLDI